VPSSGGPERIACTVSASTAAVEEEEEEEEEEASGGATGGRVRARRIIIPRARGVAPPDGAATRRAVDARGGAARWSARAAAMACDGIVLAVVERARRRRPRAV
jgi:hypothetical protein